ncbi:DUF222 domain-containing protein [Agrococcus sp. SL85]|uniref:DUF222 domain-containing protein n=1 Tax=Agrococcus sp. SL85 TaxID=2995141 RepID=UPI00226CEFC8|nr:DUF222 domain-containing protein [Agrococcus sp. SL85]WAC67544.1 DUF222 domain-containing protein [Agrococcus sp. SL85]
MAAPGASPAEPASASTAAVAEHALEAVVRIGEAIASLQAMRAHLLAARERRADRTVEAEVGDAMVETAAWPATLRALGEARIHRGHLRVMAEIGLPLQAQEARDAFEAALLPPAERTTPGRLRAIARRELALLLERPLEERHRAARARRGVSVTDLDDGMSILRATVPTLLAHGVVDRLTRIARTASAEDPRTIDQRPADALCDLLLTGDATGVATDGIRAEVAVVIPATTLAGIDDEPSAARRGSSPARPSTPRPRGASPPRRRAGRGSAPIPCAAPSSPPTATSPPRRRGGCCGIATRPAGSPAAARARTAPTSTTPSLGPTAARRRSRTSPVRKPTPEAICNTRPMSQVASRQELYVPDRFEQLREVGTGQLRTVINPVVPMLDEFAARFADMRGAGRGGFWVLRGAAGSGKSTFLDTIGLFKSPVSTERVPFDADIAVALGALPKVDAARVVVIEGREALLDVSEAALESSMHAINQFVRSPKGANTLVVWPTNTDELAAALVALGDRLGGLALLSPKPIIHFSGPPKTDYVQIAEKTVAALNEGASLTALGVSDEAAAALVDEALTVGDYLTLLRAKLIQNGAHVRELLTNEQPRVWTIVIASNDPEGDVAALTRGGLAYADVDRLLTATNANVVSELREQPDTIGILGTVLDAKILHVEILAVLAIARAFADEPLRQAMVAAGLSTNRDKSAISRIQTSQLGLILSGKSLGPRRRGGRPGGSTLNAYRGLATIAQKQDGLLNRALAEAVVAAGLADSYELEVVIGTDYTYTSDILLVRGDERIRLEVMWRTETGQAAIANYVLLKLRNYAKAIGLLV